MANSQREVWAKSVSFRAFSDNYFTYSGLFGVQVLFSYVVNTHFFLKICSKGGKLWELPHTEGQNTKKGNLLASFYNSVRVKHHRGTVKGVTRPQVRSLPGVESDGRPCGAHAPPGRQGGAAQEAAVPRTAPLLALEATLTLRGITSCWVCCEPAGAI